jgi:hypothetical protein
MAETIAKIVNDGLREAALSGDSRARRIADDVIEALEARDADIVSDLMAARKGTGVSKADLRAVLTEVGLVPTPPEPTNGGSDPGGTVVGITLDAWAQMQTSIDSLNSRCARLEEVARRAGVMGRPVGD